jgi:hypothetical protein
MASRPRLSLLDREASSFCRAVANADMIGMSRVMVDHYCRLSEQWDNALAAVTMMERAANGRNVVSFK